jgi:glyoxylase-like metal-dependent hydrolase (beta-lactamase superfamily II)
MAKFYSAQTQALFDNILWLPQEGATTGPTGRPPNSYAYLVGGRSIIIDGVYSWTLPGLAALADAGTPPAAFVLTHVHVAEGDAFETIRDTYGAPFLLHPADAAHAMAKRANVPFLDPVNSSILKDAGLDVIPFPFHTPGSIMLHTPKNNGVLFAGDSAVGPGPRQPADPPRLERPKVDSEAEDARFREEWGVLATLRFMNSVLPLHGTPYVQRADIKMLMNLLSTGPAMNPAIPAEDESVRLEASGVG